MVLGVGACGPSTDSANDVPMHVVQRGSLTITVRERGELRAAEDERVSSELEGRNTLIYLIPEGTQVQTGELLAELDVSAIEEKRSSEAISVAKAKAALDQARKNLEIVEKELIAAENTAENRLLIAELRAEKLLGQPRENATSTAEKAEPELDYEPGTNAEMISKLRGLFTTESVDAADEAAQDPSIVEDLLKLLGRPEDFDLQMGELANQVLQSINEISLARADLELIGDTLHFSRSLHERGFLTKNELDRDELEYQRRASQITLAWNNLALLVRYTLPESMIETRQEVENAKLGLESVRAAGDARRIREAAELLSAEAEFDLAEARLENWTKQIEAAVLVAPSPGLVVYGRWDWDEPVYEGMEVRQRQEIVILPDISHMVSDVKVNEAQIDKVAVGQRCSIRVDAFPGTSFEGRVLEVSTLPDPAPSYRRDVKQYSVTVGLDDENTDGSLRPGMSATIEIDVGTLHDILVVPLPAISRRENQHFVWREVPGGPEAVPVELGSNNLSHVEIRSGLAEGNRIYLTPPEGVEIPDAEDEGGTQESGSGVDPGSGGSPVSVDERG